METITTETTLAKGKIYTETAILIGMVLGGPLAAVYMFISNRRTMNMPVNAPKIWILSIAGLIALIGLSSFIPKEGVGGGIAVGLLIGTRGYINATHAPALNKYLSEGGEKYPITRVIAIGIISLIATAALIAPFALL
jgi:energy-converting hydrogenase Eha subunit B